MFLIFWQLQPQFVLKNSSASDALSKLHWKPLAEHRAIFMFKAVNNLFMHTLFTTLLTATIIIIIHDQSEILANHPHTEDGGIGQQ